MGFPENERKPMIVRMARTTMTFSRSFKLRDRARFASPVR
jgi:hypothetical protein